MNAWGWVAIVCCVISIISVASLLFTPWANDPVCPMHGTDCIDTADDLGNYCPFANG